MDAGGRGSADGNGGVSVSGWGREATGVVGVGRRRCQMPRVGPSEQAGGDVEGAWTAMLEGRLCGV